MTTGWDDIIKHCDQKRNIGVKKKEQKETLFYDLQIK